MPLCGCNLEPRVVARGVREVCRVWAGSLLTVALDGIDALGHLAVVPVGRGPGQGQEDQEDAGYPQVHLVKLNLKRYRVLEFVSSCRSDLELFLPGAWRTAAGFRMVGTLSLGL